MQRFLLDLLTCPNCRGTLAWRIEARSGDHVETGTPSRRRAVC